jgi:hypothetical protein
MSAALSPAGSKVRKVLKMYELHRVEGLFDNAYNYIAANY